jgi:hypothetical protein
MPGTTGPRHGFVWGYSPGETTWGVGAFNPNFAKLEALLHLSVTSITSTPPLTPANGMVYIVGGSPTGVWAGHANAVAAYYTIGTPAWVFLAPVTGVRAWNVATSTYWRYNGTAWVEEPASGDVSGPATSVANAVPVYADATGKLLADSGIDFADLLQIGAPLVTNNLITVDLVGRAIDSGIPVGGLGTGDVIGPGVSVAGHLPSFADATGTLLDDSGVPVADLALLGGTLVNGNLVAVNAGGDLVDAGIAAAGLGTGDVTGPGSSTTGHLASYADGTGELLADSAIPAATVAQTAGTLTNGHLLAADASGKVVDSGITAVGIGSGDVVGPASATTGHLATFASGTGKLLADGAIAAAAVAQTAGALANGHLLAADAAGKVVDSGLTTAGVTAGALPAGTANYDQLVWNGTTWAPQRPKYVFGFNVPGVLALNTVFSHVFSKAVTIPANFGAYLGHATQVRGSANATSSPVVTVAKATAGSPLSFSTVGTITITAGGVVPALATSGGAALNFAQGDIARFTCTTGDTTFADLTATVVGFET